MLAARRKFCIGGKEFETPLLVPSFSSKGFSNVASLTKNFSEALANSPFLISAFDLCYHKVRPQYIVDQLIFVDSGGYEKGGVFDLSDPINRHLEASKKKWSLKEYTKTIAGKWDVSKRPTVLVSYDNARSINIYDFVGQIDRAKKTANAFPETAINFLIKPTPDLAGEVSGFFDKTKLANALRDKKSLLSDFAILGVTEKELGRSLAERVQTIGVIRRALGSDTPIHIFGSLDPITSPIYFCAGADIFDGLTWLRYGYVDGLTCYQQNALARENIIHETSSQALHRLRVHNLRELEKIKGQMIQFLSVDTDPYKVFKFNSETIQLAIEQSLADETGG